MLFLRYIYAVFHVFYIINWFFSNAIESALSDDESDPEDALDGSKVLSGEYN